MVDILNTTEDVIPFLDRVRAAADQNRESLGFLPASAYEQIALQGRLWVAVMGRVKYLGHLLFGGSYPYLRIVQLCIEGAHRGKGAGSLLVEELIRFGEEMQYLVITARVAADLPANDFWEKQGFCIVKVSPGGKTKNRIINTRVYSLDTPRLFDLPVTPVAFASTISYDATPILRTASYSLDLNIIIDLVRHRPSVDAVGSLVRLALNNVVKLVVTEEVSQELARAHPPGSAQDPLLELVRQLPTLPVIDRAELADQVDELRAIVFPHRSATRKGAQQDESDLIHLATCIHHGISGFVTSEIALLRSSNVVRQRFGLEVVSPFNFLEVSLDGQALSAALVAQNWNFEISFVLFNESDRHVVEAFLLSLGVPAADIPAALSPGASGSTRQRMCAFLDGELAGIAAWDLPSKFKRQVELFLYVDESRQQVERIIEHFLRVVLDSYSSARIFGIRLQHGAGQAITRSIAVSRGFRSQDPTHSSYHTLYKIAVCGPVTPDSWGPAMGEVGKLAGVEFPEHMPSFEAVDSNGLELLQSRKNIKVSLSCFELETLLSPGLFIFPGRLGLMIPIREAYAEQLFGGVRKQISFLPVQEALLRIEKAYFRQPARAKMARKGMPVVFYVSGETAGFAVGHARITATAVTSVRDAILQYERQGVLPEVELINRADRQGRIHVITFDNFCKFRSRVDYGRLKNLGCVGPLNFQTVEYLSAEKMRTLVAEGESDHE